MLGRMILKGMPPILDALFVVINGEIDGIILLDK